MKPNIVFILADDIGVNDVSWNKASAPTPTLGSLAEQGVILESAYTLPVCSPSRAALMTGVYPFRFGFQRGFGRNVPEGLPVDLKLLPKYLQEVGYSTHGFGKWHLGYCSDSYHPTNRGFHTFEGPLIGDESDLSAHKSSLYYVNSALRTVRKQEKPFFVFLSLLTKPYYVPEDKETTKDVVNARRVKIRKMDKAVKRLMDGLKGSGSLNNTVVIFVSDNGGRYIAKARGKTNPNYPLKGHKNTIYEGGTKVPGFLFSPLINRGRGGSRYSGLLHMVDFLPTLLDIAGGVGEAEALPQGHLPLDGVSQWRALTGQSKQKPRDMIVYNIDDLSLPPILAGPTIYEKYQTGIRVGRYKLIWGQPGMLKRGHHNPGNSNGPLENEMQTLEMYDLEDDPGETINLALRRSSIKERLQQKVLELYPSMVPPIFQSGPVPSEVDTIITLGRVYKWCRAVKATTCNSPSQGLVQYNLNNTLIQIFRGTLQHTSFICNTQLEQ